MNAFVQSLEFDSEFCTRLVGDKMTDVFYLKANAAVPGHKTEALSAAIVSTTLRSSYFEIVGFLEHVLRILEMVDKNFCLMSGFYGNTSNNAIFSKK